MELFLNFKEQYPEIVIRQRAFEYMKPYFVRKLRDRYTCCCISHVQMSFLKDAINHMRSSVFGLHGKACQCQCNICKDNGGCKAPKNPIKSVTALLDSILCPKSDTSTFHALACLSGQCKRCGPAKLDFCAAEAAFNAKKIVVKIFEDLEVGTARDGKKKKRKVLSHKEISCQVLSVMFKDHLKKYIMHNFVYRWQAEQYKECIQSFPEDVVVSVVDFAENYSFKEQNEIQSMHWYSSQVTIFVHITYFRIAGNGIPLDQYYFLCTNPSIIFDFYIMQVTSTRQFTSSFQMTSNMTHILFNTVF